MPNHVCNKVEFHGEPNDVKAVLNLIAGDDGRAIDFNKILPMPDYIFRGDLGIEEEKKYGKNNWYDWSIENWGTKWNAYETERVDDNTIKFETAWSCPVGMYRKLTEICNSYNVYMTGCWCDEDYDGGNIGNFDSEDGDFNYWYEDDPKEISYIYLETWGYDIYDELTDEDEDEDE